jgi:predicted amidohydrolase
MVSVAIAQITSRPFTKEENRRLCEAAVVDAAHRPAHLIVLPEVIVPGQVLQSG